jgi:hypothetical protein
MNPHTPKWASILGVRLNNYLYHQKALGNYKFEMGLHEPFGHLKHKLWPKEGPKVKLTIWLLITKSRKLPWFYYVQVVWDISLERFWQGLQCFFKPHFNQRFAHKVMGPKVTRVPILGISGVPFGSLGTKWHLDASLVAKHIVHCKGKVVFSP